MVASKIANLIQKAESARKAHLRNHVHEAWRLINGPADGAPPGLSVDFYQQYLVVNARASVATETLEQWCETLRMYFSPPGLVCKMFAENVSESTSYLFHGEWPRAPFVIREGEVQLFCYLNEEFATGLYLDLHDVRLWLGSQTKGIEVLNLFSYTCSFSAHAAFGGARRVTSVDASKRALNRGRENMTINGLDPHKHRWFSDDVLTHLKRAVKRGDRYDLIILDPPAFGRAGKRVFELKRDLPSLLSQTLSLLVDGGRLLLSVHTAGFEPSDLLSELHASAKNQNLHLKLIKNFGLPVWDHPVLADKPGDRGDYLQVLVVEAKCA